jgi:hypothetical protein
MRRSRRPSGSASSGSASSGSASCRSGVEPPTRSRSRSVRVTANCVDSRDLGAADRPHASRARGPARRPPRPAPGAVPGSARGTGSRPRPRARLPAPSTAPSSSACTASDPSRRRPARGRRVDRRRGVHVVTVRGPPQVSARRTDRTPCSAATSAASARGSRRGRRTRPARPGHGTTPSPPTAPARRSAAVARPSRSSCTRTTVTVADRANRAGKHHSTTVSPRRRAVLRGAPCTGPVTPGLGRTAARRSATATAGAASLVRGAGVRRGTAFLGSRADGTPAHSP